MQPQVQQMAEKIEHIPQECWPEINNFIEYIQQREINKRLNTDFAQASNTTFSKVWDNEDDALYDNL